VWGVCDVTEIQNCQEKKLYNPNKMEIEGRRV
jgi:hypothetical protein